MTDSVDEQVLAPSGRALSDLHRRIESDADLKSPFKEAFLADLSSADPASLTNLREALKAKEGANAA